MFERKPTPLIPTRDHSRGPARGELSDSSDGLHPQYSVRMADEKRKNRITREKLWAEADRTATPVVGISPWHGRCPKCSGLQHFRKIVRGYGPTFTVRARPPTCEDQRT